jgi:DNA polymerase
MTQDWATTELSALLQQTQERLTYFQELGVTGIEPLPASQNSAVAASEDSLEQIWSELKDCTRCSLHEGRTHLVNTEGNRHARLMFVGEAPGADEDAQARPFVGRAGQLLTKIIEAIGLKREDVLIGNVNRCRPPGNRAPMPDEAATCKPFLLREIEAVKPEVIVVLGLVSPSSAESFRNSTALR